MFIKKCSCGSTKFDLAEGYAWSCEVDEDGVLDCFKPNSEIENITCRECGKEYNEGDFKTINFD